MGSIALACWVSNHVFTAHVATAKVLREQFRQPRTAPASLDDLVPSTTSTED
jgi:hypothetical protein